MLGVWNFDYFCHFRILGEEGQEEEGHENQEEGEQAGQEEGEQERELQGEGEPENWDHPDDPSMEGITPKQYFQQLYEAVCILIK